MPVQPVVILGHVLLLEGEDEHCFVLKADLRSPGLASFRRPLLYYEVCCLFSRGCASFLAKGAFSGMFQIRNQQDGNARQCSSYGRREGGNRLLQILL